MRSWKPDTGEQRVWPVPAEIGSMALRSRGGMVLALRDGFAFLDLESGEVTPLHDPEPDLHGNRFNDGKCDPQGRFWAGTMDCEEVEGLGSLYRLDHDHSCHRMVDGVICSNGLGWSPDGRTMYYTDTWTRRIDAFDFDPATGEVGNRRIFAEVPDGEGVARRARRRRRGWSVVSALGRVEGGAARPGRIGRRRRGDTGPPAHQLRIRRVGPARPLRHLGQCRTRPRRSRGGAAERLGVPGQDRRVRSDGP